MAALERHQKAKHSNRTFCCAECGVSKESVYFFDIWIDKFASHFYEAWSTVESANLISFYITRDFIQRIRNPNTWSKLHTSCHRFIADYLLSNKIKIKFCGFQTKKENSSDQWDVLFIPPKLIFLVKICIDVKRLNLSDHKWDLIWWQ